jgi:hypothetical protein
LYLTFLNSKELPFFFLSLLFFLASALLEVKKRNKELSGAYTVSYFDSTLLLSVKQPWTHKTCKLFLNKDGSFKIINAPEGLKDTIGRWSYVTDGNYFGIGFSNESRELIYELDGSNPFGDFEIEVEDSLSHQDILKFKREKVK